MTTFWGLICESGNRYKQKVESQFHLTMAALDPKSQKSNKLASVYVENQGTEYLICNLNGEKNLQERVDLMFAQDEEVTFFVKGEGTVHLTGYEMPEDDFGMNGDMYDDEELEDEEEEALPVVNGKRKNVEQVNAAANGNKKLKGKDAKAQVVDIDATKLDKKADKKPQQQQNNKQQQAKKPAQPAADDDDDDDILGNIDSDIDSEELDKLINQGSDDDLDEEDDFEDEDDEDDLDDDDDSEEEKLKSVQQKVKGKLNGQAAGKQAQPTPNKPQQQQQQKNAQTPKTNQQNQAKTPQTQNKNQQNQGKTPNQKNNNQNQNNQNRQQTPFVKGNNNKQQQNSNKKETNDTKPQAEQKPKEQSKGLAVKKLPNGLIIQDIQDGSGPEAQKGKYLRMNYVGRLTNNRVFDQTKNKPFAFRLGMGEVIKGWDQGIQGMKVGGKRRLTIPANLAYGKSGVGDIPPNATLIFDVELKGVN